MIKASYQHTTKPTKHSSVGYVAPTFAYIGNSQISSVGFVASTFKYLKRFGVMS